MFVGGGSWLACSAVPRRCWRWREHRLEGASVGSITRFQPDALQSLGNDHRHPIVQWGHQAVGLRRDHAAGLHFTAIGADPSVPDTGQPEQLPVFALDQMPLFKKAGAGQKAAVMTPWPAKGGFLRDGFGAGVDRPRRLPRVGEGWLPIACRALCGRGGDEVLSETSTNRDERRRRTAGECRP